MTWRLRVNPITCDAHGMCAELLPEAVDLDDWGFPIVRADLPDDLVGLARRAVASCPTLALSLVDVPDRQPTAAPPRSAPPAATPSRPSPATRRAPR
jgi:ferredoxin